MNLKLLVFILFWSICSDIWSQQFPNYHLGTREGLPHSIVYRVMEDQRGFLWISTEGGIARYDGTNMQCYAAESGLEADMVLHVSEDENQVIWANVYLAGPHRLVDGKFEPDQPLRGKWPLVPVKSVHTPGRTWCLDADGFLYVKDGDEVKQDTSLGDGKIFRDMLVCTDGRMVVLTTKGLYTFLEAGTWQKMDLPSEIKEVECMTVDASGALWLANQQGFYRLENGKVSRYLPWEKENPPDQFVVDRAGKVWASDFESLYLEQEGSYTNVTSRLGRKDLKINHLFIDHQNNLWISTYGSGLICVQSVQILNFLSSLPQLRSPINAITHTQDKLYFACVGLISQYEEGIISPVYSPFHGRKDYPYFIQKWGENLIVGNPSGAFLFDPDEPEKQKSLISEGVLAAYIDSSGGQYLGTYRGLWHKVGQEFREMSGPLVARRVNCIAQWQGELVVGTDSGLFVMRGNSVKRLAGLPELREKYILALQEDQEQGLWVASRQGSYLLGGKGQTSCNKLQIPRATCFLEDKRGRIWVGTLNGLYCFEGTDTTRLDASQGLISNQIRSLDQDGQGYLWVGASEGLSRIDIRAFQALKNPVKVRIKSIAFDSTKISFPHEVTLPSTSRNIRIAIAGIQYPYQSENHFLYQVKNLQETWYPLDGQILQFSSLPPGNYTLKVKHKTSAKDETQMGILEMYIVAPFYTANWFLFLCVICGILLIMGIFWGISIRRMQRSQRRLQQRLRFVLLRSQALQAMVNPHFIFNSLNSVLGLVQADRKQEVKDYVTGFSRLLRTVLDRSGEAEISIRDEIAALRLYLELEQKRYGARLQFEIRCDPEIDQTRMIPNMLLQPFVENAVQHGIAPLELGGKVWLFLRKKGEGLEILIEDNGEGMSWENRNKIGRKPMGIALIRQRLQVLQEISGKPQQLFIEGREPGGGTSIRFLLM